MKTKWIRIAASLMVCTTALHLHAAVIGGGDAGHTTAPLNDPGWSRVGRVGTNGSGVYLGNGWVLTASHVASKTTFVVEGDQTYTLLPGPENVYQVRNPSDTLNVDLYLFRVGIPQNSGLEPLGMIPLAQTLPSIGTVGMHIGTGRGQTSSSLTTWYVNTAVNPWTWSTSPSDPDNATAGGYVWGDAASRQTRWNFQPLNETGLMLGNTSVFSTSFEALMDYGMAADNDSGSPIFFDINGEPVIGGIALSVATFSGQPSGTGVFGNLSVYADLSVYHDQIMAVVIPELRSALLAAILLGLFCIYRFPKLGR